MAKDQSTQSFFRFIWKNMEGKTKEDFNEAFLKKFGYTSTASSNRIFTRTEPTINQANFLKKFLMDRDLWNALEEAYQAEQLQTA